jgi:hypothetical protein
MHKKNRRLLKSKDLEIRKLKEENNLLKASNDVSRQKIQDLNSSIAAAKKPRKPARKPSSLQGLSTTDFKSQSSHTSIGTQSGLINMALIRDRTIRHSKEAELTVAQAELQRLTERNAKLLEQVGSLHRMVKRAGETLIEESGKSRQEIGDLQRQVTEKDGILKKKGLAYTKLRRENEELSRAAARIEPLKRCILLVFKDLRDRMEPLIAIKAVPKDISELNDLSQELFNVPITKICQPITSGLLRRQEMKLNRAIGDEIGVSDVTGVFGVLFDELQRLTEGKEGVGE